MREIERHRVIMILLLALWLAGAAVTEVKAQQFSVASFRQLPNDVSAFINPVKDLNDEDCGLVKVIASEDFVFSSPLGIVKREDKTGEIWLWMPRGSKKITIKHADYGVLRDYAFPTKIDSHMTYEMKIDEPVKQIAKDTVSPIVTVVTDTLVLTRTDTLVVAPVKERIPFSMNVLATFNYGGRAKVGSGGVLITAMKRHGGFMHLSTDFGKIGTILGECSKDGEIDGLLPYYTGRVRKSTFMLNGGAVHRLSRKVSVFEGLGYSSVALAWQLAESEGGGYVKNSHYSYKGVSFEAGALLTLGRVSLSASVITIRGREWFGSIGAGIRIGK